jgi:hypothetical protein
MDDATANATVINARRTSIMRQKRLDLLPLLVAQPKQLAHGK